MERPAERWDGALGEETPVSDEPKRDRERAGSRVEDVDWEGTSKQGRVDFSWRLAFADFMHDVNVPVAFGGTGQGWAAMGQNLGFMAGKQQQGGVSSSPCGP